MIPGMRVKVALNHPLSGQVGNIVSTPNDNVAWVKLDNKEGEYGVEVSKLEEIDTAMKFDTGKTDYSQISYELMEHVSRVRMFGEKKYARNNWKKGFKVTRSLAAALRHIFAILRGEIHDPESGLYHVAHAICCLEHALFDLIHHPDNIDV